MDKGYIKIYRSIQDWPYYFDAPFTKTQAWIDLLILANHSEKQFSIRGNVVKIQRGQVGHSADSLAKRWRWSRNKVLRFFSLLVNGQQVKQQKSRVLGVITIINYDKYNPRTKDSATDGATERQQKVQQKDTNNNVNNEKNEKKGENTRAKKKYGDKMTEEDFETFWNAYPRKTAKAPSRRKFMSLEKTLLPKILESVEKQKKLEQWKLDQGKFIPFPITWLNQCRWEDELETGVQPPKRQPGETDTDFFNRL